MFTFIVKVVILIIIVLLSRTGFFYTVKRLQGFQVGQCSTTNRRRTTTEEKRKYKKKLYERL